MVAEMNRMLIVQQDRVLARISLLGRYHEWAMRRDEQLRETEAEIEEIVEVMSRVLLRMGIHPRYCEEDEQMQSDPSLAAPPSPTIPNMRNNWYLDRLGTLQKTRKRLREEIAQLESPHGSPDVLDINALFRYPPVEGAQIKWLNPSRFPHLPSPSRFPEEDKEELDGIVMNTESDSDGMDTKKGKLDMASRGEIVMSDDETDSD